MENTSSTGRSTPVAVYYTKRRTPSARGKSWVGTLLFIFSFPALFVLAAMNAGRSALLIPGIMILGGIIFWIISGVEQNGTISFYDNKIVHKCRREVFELYPGQVSSVSQSGKVVKIIFSGKTLTFVSDNADQITQSVDSFISTYAPANTGYAAPVAPVVSIAPVNTSAPVSDKTEEIRKYKQLVDDGVITQEQFDAILKKML